MIVVEQRPSDPPKATVWCRGERVHVWDDGRIWREEMPQPLNLAPFQQHGTYIVDVPT